MKHEKINQEKSVSADTSYDFAKLAQAPLALASIFAGQFAVPAVQMPPERGIYDATQQLFVSVATGQPAFAGAHTNSDTTVAYSDFCKPTGSTGSDDTTYSAPDGFTNDG